MICKSSAPILRSAIVYSVCETHTSAELWMSVHKITIPLMDRPPILTFLPVLKDLIYARHPQF